MKQIILVHLALACSAATFGQPNFGFGQGYIVTKQNDTISCQVELAVTYGDQIAYRSNSDGPQNHIPSKNVRSIKTPAQYYENIQVGKKELLMGLLVDGRACLFTHVTINRGPSRPSNGGTMTFYDPPTIVYALKKDGQYFEIKKKNFSPTIMSTLSDCPAVVEKVTNKDYTIDDLEKLVTEYNSCR